MQRINVGLPAHPGRNIVDIPCSFDGKASLLQRIFQKSRGCGAACIRHIDDQQLLVRLFIERNEAQTVAEQADTFLIALRAGVIDKGNIRRAALLCLNRVFPEGAHTP